MWCWSQGKSRSPKPVLGSQNWHFEVPDKSCFATNYSKLFKLAGIKQACELIQHVENVFPCDQHLPFCSIPSYLLSQSAQELMPASHLGHKAAEVAAQYKFLSKLAQKIRGYRGTCSMGRIFSRCNGPWLGDCCFKCTYCSFYKYLFGSPLKFSLFKAIKALQAVGGTSG